jgi:hypothetical protein
VLFVTYLLDVSVALATSIVSFTLSFHTSNNVSCTTEQHLAFVVVVVVVKTEEVTHLYTRCWVDPRLSLSQICSPILDFKSS